MDYTKFVLGEDYIHNPNHNNRTKAGRAQPEFILNDDINHVDVSMDELLSRQERNSWYGEWSDDKRKNFEKYNVYENRVDTEEDYRRNRAKNQKWTEQMLRSFGQIAVNEVAIGSILALSDLADIMINLGKETGEDDYTNPVSQYLTDAQNQIREKLEIYRTDPNKAFDPLDAGWWWDNFVSVGSSASLLIPSMGVTAAISKVGKLAKLATRGTKFGRLADSGRWLSKIGVKNPYTVKNAIGRFADSAIPSVISRQMEDMLEARETYNETYDKAMQQFANMTDAEREQFYERNKDIVYNEDGSLKMDHEIAKYIADKAATYTFVNDFKYIGFDILQFNNILRFGAKPLTRATNKIQTDVLKQLAKGTENAAEETLEKASRSELFKDAIKFYAKNPKIALKNVAEATEFTEGIEEMAQGITQDNAKGEYERFFNPNYTNRTISSQLSDPQLWNQGFWGMAGGVVFKGAGKGAKYAWNAYKAKRDGEKLSEMDINKLMNKEEYIRQEEIQARLTESQTLEAKLKLWAQGYNPQQKIYDADGNEIKNDYSNGEDFSKMSEDEKELVFDDIINEYLTNMTTRAVDVGNGELLEAFIKSDDFSKYIDRIAGSNEQIKGLKEKMINRFEEVKNEYYKNLENVFGSIDVQSEYLGKALATNMTRNEMHIRDMEKQDADLEEQILQNTDDAHYDTYKRKRLIGEVNKNVGQLLTEKQNLEKDLDAKKINKTQYNSRIKEIDKCLDELYKIGDIGKMYEEFNKTLPKELKNYDTKKMSDDLAELSKKEIETLDETEKQIGKVPDSVKGLINRQIKTEIQLAVSKSQRIESQEDLQSAYDDFLAAQEDIIDNRFKHARNNILNYIEQAESPAEAYNSLFDGTAPKDIQEQFDMFKVGNELYSTHTALFKAAAMDIEEKNNIANEEKTPEEKPNLEENEIEEEKSQNVQESDVNSETVEEENVQPVQTAQQNENSVINDENKNESPVTGVEIEEEKATKEELQGLEFGEEDEQPSEVPEGELDDITQIEINVSGEVFDYMSKMSSEDRIALREQSINSEAYKNLLNHLIRYAKTVPETKNMKEEDIIKLCEYTLAETIENLVKNFDFETRSKFYKLASDIRNSYKQSATTQEIKTKQEQSVKALIDEYITLKGDAIRHDKNGKPIINIGDLFSELLNIYDRTILDLCNPILEYLREDIKNNHQYFIEDSEKISAYLHKPNQLIQYLTTLKVSKEIYGQKENNYGNTPAMHANMPWKAYKGMKAIEKLKAGDVRGAILETDDKKGTIKVIFNGYERYQFDRGKDNVYEAVRAYKDWLNAYNSYKNNPNARIIAFKFGQSIIYRVDDGTMTFDELESLKGEVNTLGVLATVHADKDNTTFGRDKTKTGEGLFFEVKKNDDGTYSSQFDTLLIDIITSANEQAAKIDELLRKNVTKFSKEELKLIEDYFDLKNRNDIALRGYDHTKGLTNEQAHKLLYDYVNPIIWESAVRMNQLTDPVSWYYTYLEKMHDNYYKTYALQNQIDEASSKGEVVIAEASVYDMEYVEASDEYYTIQPENFDYKTTDIMFVDDDGKIHTAGKNNTYKNDYYYSKGSFGIVLKNNFQNGNPAIAWLSGGTPLSKNKIVYEAFKNTLKNIILDAYKTDVNKKHKIAFKTLFDRVTQLFGNQSIAYGINAKALCEECWNNFDKIVANDDYTVDIDKIVNKYMKDAKFNLSLALAKGKLIKENEFFKVNENNEIIAKLDNKETKVGTFAQFVINSRAFKTNQTLESYSENRGELQNSIFFSNKYSTISPVKGDDRIGTYVAVKEKLEKASDGSPIEVRDILTAAGVEEEQIDILLGSNTGVSFMNKEIYYMPKTKDNDYAYYDKESGKVYITNNYGELIDEEDKQVYRQFGFKSDLIRLLIHENIHKNFAELTEEERKYVTKELSKIFLSYTDTILADTDSALAKTILDGFKDTRWNEESIRELAKNIRENKITDEQLEDAMNEFLAETLSQQALIEYLNSKDYTGEQIEVNENADKNKSIWERIVDLIIEFFNKFSENFSVKNLHNSKNNTIFANEYRLLSGIGKDKIVNKTDSAVAEQYQTESPIQSEANLDNNDKNEQKEENDEPNLDDANMSYDDDYNTHETKNYATTKNILTGDEIRLREHNRNGAVDTSGIVSVKDMTQFVNRFGKSRKANFSSMLKNGALSYACK